MIFGSWHNLLRVLLVGALGYAGLVALLRVSGKRTLAKLNAFDWVVTVALGSALASVLLPRGATLADGVLALAVLIGAQFVVAWLQVRVRTFRALVKSEPTLLYFQGRWLDDALRRERVAPDELLAAVRGSGTAHLDDVAAVVLETDGSLSVVRGPARPGPGSSLSDVRGAGG